MNENPDELAGRIESLMDDASGLPPIENWHPDYSGDIDIRIARDGQWYYLGESMAREALVRLFASILRREDDQCYYLITPVEKWRIQVDDLPFVAHSLERVDEGAGQQLYLTTSIGERLAISRAHPLQVEHCPNTAEPRPWVYVRRGLEAKILTSAFYDLAAIAEPQGETGQYGVWSQGEFFVLGQGA
ncbi:MAG: DUF1285 domain-containing protein [Marinobacter sp.]|nr:DUF1285 domain-containing protein [Marinobacter sp.]